MRIEFPFERCILCLERPADSWEHLLPQCIGGRLQLKFLCTECNNTLGSKLVSALRSDPGVKVSVKALRDTLPVLYQAFQEGQVYHAEMNDGSILSATYRKGKLRVIPGPGKNGAVIKSSPDTRKDIERTLKKRGYISDQIHEILADFDRLQDNSPLELPDGRVVIKKAIPPLNLDLKGNWIDDRLAGLIAYEFATTIVAEKIYNHRLDPVRRYILGGDPTPLLKVQRFVGRQAEPAHAICVLPQEDSLIVDIRLFRALIFKVTFEKVVFRAQTPVYFEDLKGKRSMVASSLEDAQKSRWMVNE